MELKQVAQSRLPGFLVGRMSSQGSDNAIESGGVDVPSGDQISPGVYQVICKRYIQPGRLQC